LERPQLITASMLVDMKDSGFVSEGRTAGMLGALLIWLVLIPVEGTFVPQVDVTRFEDHEEGEQDPEKIPATFEELERPWVQESDFEVKNQEEHGDQIKFDGVTFPGTADSLPEATLVRFHFGMGSLAHGVDQIIGDHNACRYEYTKKRQNR